MTGITPADATEAPSYDRERMRALLKVSAAYSNDNLRNDLDAEDLLEEQSWRRDLLTKWPMLYDAISYSSEILVLESGPDVVGPVLVRSGASYNCEADGWPLPPVAPFVLDWMDGRTWRSDCNVVLAFHWAVDALAVLGPERLPSDETEWHHLLDAFESAIVTCQHLGPRPAQVLGVEGIEKLVALFRGAEISPYGKNEEVAAEICKEAFGFGWKAKFQERLEDPADLDSFREALLRMPVPFEPSGSLAFGM